MSSAPPRRSRWGSVARPNVVLLAWIGVSLALAFLGLALLPPSALEEFSVDREVAFEELQASPPSRTPASSSVLQPPPDLKWTPVARDERVPFARHAGPVWIRFKLGPLFRSYSAVVLLDDGLLHDVTLAMPTKGGGTSIQRWGVGLAPAERE